MEIIVLDEIATIPEICTPREVFKPESKSPFLIITIKDDFYIRSRIMSKIQPYFYAMDLHMCLGDRTHSLQLAVRIKNVLIKDGTIFTLDKLTLSCEEYLADTIAKILLTIDGKYFAPYFTGTDTCSYAADHLIANSTIISKTNTNTNNIANIKNNNIVKLTPQQLNVYYPNCSIEKFAFLTGYIPCLFKYKQTYRLCTQIYAQTYSKHYYCLYIQASPFRRIFHPSHIYNKSKSNENKTNNDNKSKSKSNSSGNKNKSNENKKNESKKNILQYVDETLALIDDLKAIRIMAVCGIRGNITVNCVKNFLVHTVKLLISMYPVQVRKFFPFKCDMTPYDQVLISTRYTACLQYKKYILNGGRDVALEEFANLAYLNRKNFIEEIDAIFLSLGIEPFHTLSQGLIKLTEVKSGYIVKLANLIRRRIIWVKGKDICMLPHFLKEKVYWWFDPKIGILPEPAIKFIMPRIKLQLERYLSPPLADIITQSYTRIDLTAILTPLRWDSIIYKEIISEQYSNKDLLAFIQCVFTRHTKDSTIVNNYITWINIIYGCISEQNTFLQGKDNFSYRVSHMPFKEYFICYTPKEAQQLLAHQYDRRCIKL